MALVVIILCFWSFLNSKISLFLSFLLIFLFSGFRYNIGTDYPVYLSFTSGFYDILSENYMNFEPFNVVLILVGRYFNSDYFYFIFISFIICFYFYRGIVKLSDSYFVSFIGFLFFPLFFLESMNIVRQYAAVSLVFFSYHYLFNKKFVIYYLFIFLAVLFHYSAIIMIVLPFLRLDNYSRFLNLGLVFVSLVLGFFSILYLSQFTEIGKVSYYLENNSEGYFFFFIVLTLISSINFIFYDRIAKSSSKGNFYLTIYNLGYCAFLFFYQIPVFAGRLSLYFVSILVLIFPLYNKLFKQSKLVSFCLFLALFTLFFIRLWYGSYLADEGIMKEDPYIPYRWIFDF